MTTNTPNDDESIETLASSRSNESGERIDDEWYGIYECEVCSTVCLAVRSPPKPMTCHREEMKCVTSCSMDVRSPRLQSVLLEAFGLPKPCIDICLCVVDRRAASASQVADQLEYDRSTITRYLNKLVEIGMLGRRQLNREDGGIINVYTALPMEKIKRETIIGFYVWAGEAAKLIEEANLEKEEQLNEQAIPEEDDLLFWDQLQEAMRKQLEGFE